MKSCADVNKVGFIVGCDDTMPDHEINGNYVVAHL